MYEVPETANAYICFRKDLERKPPLPFFENQKKCPDFGKKMP